MNFRRGGGLTRRREEARVEITPLIDIVFLLLIFFLITTTFVKERKPNIPIEVPRASSAQETPVDEGLTVHTSKDGRIFLGEELQVDDGALVKSLQAAKAKREDTTVLIRADSAAHHGVVVRVMDIAKQAGLSRFGIVSRQK